MKQFEVSGELVTGVEEIDSQHRELFDRLNKLLATASGRAEPREIARFVIFLRDYIEEHLNHEEKLLKEKNYPQVELEMHLNQHAHFRRVYGEIIAKFNDGQIDASAFVNQIEKSVGDWFENHIKHVDRKAMNFISGQN